MSRFSWSSGALNDQSNDLQQSRPTDPLRPTLMTKTSFCDSWTISCEQPGTVTDLLRTWGRERHRDVIADVDIDLWAGLSKKIRNCEP